jgi:hypothetical protein
MREKIISTQAANFIIEMLKTLTQVKKKTKASKIPNIRYRELCHLPLRDF